MRKLLVCFALFSGMLISLAIRAECTEPADVAIPDGATASTDEMVEGQKAVKNYVTDGQAFLDCMDGAAEPEGITEEEKKASVERYNAVVDKMQAAAEGFNTQIKAYKAAQAKK